MKYYHLIYNSSEKSVSGSAGLGVRCHTEGMPQEIIDCMNSIGLFSYSSGNLNQPNPKALFEEPGKMDEYPITYRFFKLPLTIEGREYYVLSRTVSVGFDYPYYIKFQPARVDNFVLDAYVFESMPTLNDLQIFYEDPKENSIRFLPKSPVPSENNEDMKLLSVGKMDLFAPEERSFTCNELPSLDNDKDSITKILFAIIESKMSGKKVVIKSDPNDAVRLMVGTIRVAPFLQKDLTFVTNYQVEGAQNEYNVFFVNEFYPFDYSYGNQYVIIDLTQECTINSQEKNLYFNDLYNNISDNSSEVKKYIDWVLSSEYNKVKSCSAETINNVFKYLTSPKEFTIETMFPKNDEVWGAMKSIFDNSEKQRHFDQCYSELLKSTSDETKIVDSLKKSEELIDYGFKVLPVVDKLKKETSKHVLTSVESFSNLLSEFGVEKIKHYLDKDICKTKNDYLTTPELKRYWIDLFVLFLPENQQSVDKILALMFKSKSSVEDIKKVLKQIDPRDVDTRNALIQIAEKDKTEVEKVWSILLPILENSAKEKLSLGESSAKKLKDFVLSHLTPFNEDVRKWNSITSYVLKDYNDDNINDVIEVALKYADENEFPPIISKLVPHLSAEDYSEFIKKVKDKLPKYKEISFIETARKNDLKDSFKYITSILETYKVSKRSFVKLTQKEPSLVEKELTEKILSDYYKESFVEKLVAKFGWVKIGSALGSFFLLLAAGTFFFLSQSKTSPEPSIIKPTEESGIKDSVKNGNVSIPESVIDSSKINDGNQEKKDSVQSEAKQKTDSTELVKNEPKQESAKKKVTTNSKKK